MKSVRFLNCRINLSEWNFMPRPETEFWVKKAIRALKIENYKLKISVLDIFAGTGCIGIAVLRACPELCRGVDFADIDKKAIKQIKINLKLNKISESRYRIFRSDMFARIKGKYSFIFANPPYIATERLSEVQPSVLKKEPARALFAGKKGLDVIKIFLKRAKKHLKKNGEIYLEFDPQQKKDIEEILARQGYKRYYFFKDQFFKYRFLKCSFGPIIPK